MSNYIRIFNPFRTIYVNDFINGFKKVFDEYDANPTENPVNIAKKYGIYGVLGKQNLENLKSTMDILKDPSTYIEGTIDQLVNQLDYSYLYYFDFKKNIVLIASDLISYINQIRSRVFKKFKNFVGKTVLGTVKNWNIPDKFVVTKKHITDNISIYSKITGVKLVVGDGGVITIKLFDNSLLSEKEETIQKLEDEETIQKLEDDLNKSIQEDAKMLSGCFLVDSRKNVDGDQVYSKKTVTTLVDTLSCDQSGKDSSSVKKEPICTVSDENCDNKFNPCLYPRGVLPSKCTRLLVSDTPSTEDESGETEQIKACQDDDTSCSKYCDNKYFKLVDLTSLECRDIDRSQVALEVFSSITGLSISKMLEKIEKPSRFDQVLVALNIVVFLIVLFLVYKIFFHK